MIPVTTEALLGFTLITLLIGVYIGHAYTAYRHEQETYMPERVLRPAAAFHNGAWWCAEHAPADPEVWVDPWSEVAPERCAWFGCTVEMLDLAQHRLALKELALALERFRELPPRAKDRVRAALERAPQADGCVVCGEVGVACTCDGTDAIAVMHEVGDHSRCSVWCEQKLGAVDLR